MGTAMREDVSSIISSILHTSSIDLGRMLTQENVFDATILRAFLLDTEGDEGDLADFLSETNIDGSFIRGFMAGLVQGILIERGHGEILGRPSHAEILAIYDAALAHLMESSI